jgi:hypothetical protein
LIILLLFSYSNIALKLNTKLSTCIEASCAWRRAPDEHSQPKLFYWVDEAPTLIIGIHLASGKNENEYVRRRSRILFTF